MIIYTGNELSPDDERKLEEVARKHAGTRRAFGRAFAGGDGAVPASRGSQHPGGSAEDSGSRPAQNKDNWIAGGKVLIVDDDVRNIFALTSVLERHNLSVAYAESGKEALERCRRRPESIWF